MSTTQIDQPVDVAQTTVVVERTLTVFDNSTEELTAEYPLRSFDLEGFKRHFGVEDEHDPLMFDAYPVTRDDASFVAKYLRDQVVFDFERNSYFVECSSAE